MSIFDRPTDGPLPETLGVILNYQEGQTSKDLVEISSVCFYWWDKFFTTSPSERGQVAREWTREDSNLDPTVEPSTASAGIGGPPGPPSPVVSRATFLQVGCLCGLGGRDSGTYSVVAGGHLEKLFRPNPLPRELRVLASDS